MEAQHQQEAPSPKANPSTDHFDTLYFWTSLENALRFCEANFIWSDNKFGFLEHLTASANKSELVYAKKPEICLKFQFDGVVMHVPHHYNPKSYKPDVLYVHHQAHLEHKGELGYDITSIRLAGGHQHAWCAAASRIARSTQSKAHVDARTSIILDQIRFHLRSRRRFAIPIDYEAGISAVVPTSQAQHQDLGIAAFEVQVLSQMVVRLSPESAVRAACRGYRSGSGLKSTQLAKSD